MWFWLVDFHFIANKMVDGKINKVKYHGLNIVWVSHFQRRNYHQNQEINHPELTCGLLQTCYAKKLCCYYTSWDILCPNRKRKQVKKMYVKQPQNILSNHKILKIKMEEHEVEKKKRILEKSWVKYILSLFCLLDILVQLYLHQEKLFS